MTSIFFVPYPLCPNCLLSSSVKMCLLFSVVITTCLLLCLFVCHPSFLYVPCYLISSASISPSFFYDSFDIIVFLSVCPNYRLFLHLSVSEFFVFLYNALLPCGSPCLFFCLHLCFFLSIFHINFFLC